MAINKVPAIVEYWRVDNLIGNDGMIEHGRTQWFETVFVRSLKIYILQITERTIK